MSDDPVEINQILLDDGVNKNGDLCVNISEKKKKKKHFYIPFLPRMYWLFYRKPINFLIFIPSLAEGWCDMATTICMGNIIDAINKENGMQIVKMNAIYSLIAAVVCAIFAYFNYSLWIILGDSIGNKIKRMLFKSLMEKDIEFFDKNTIGNLLVHLQQDCSMVSDAFTDLKTHQVSSIGKFLIAFFVMYSVDFKLATFSLFAQISITYIVKIFRQFGCIRYLKYLDFLSQGVTISDESIGNEKVVFSFNRQKEQIKLYDEKLQIACDHDAKSRFCMRTSFLLGDLINDTCISVVLNIGAFFVIKNKFSAGHLFTLSRSAIWAGKEINHIFDTLTNEQRAVDSSNRIFKIIDFPVDIKDEIPENDFEYDNRMRNIEASFTGKV